jgi:predicted transcriptional regulator
MKRHPNPSRGITNLAKPAKIELVHEMRELGKTYKEIAEILGVKPLTAIRYAKITNPEQWQELGKNIGKVIAIEEEKLMASVVAKLKNDLPSAKYSEAVDVYKTLKESKSSKDRPSVNVTGNEMKVEFIQA